MVILCWLLPGGCHTENVEETERTGNENSCNIININIAVIFFVIYLEMDVIRNCVIHIETILLIVILCEISKLHATSSVVNGRDL